MINYFIWLGVLAGILAIVSLAGYRIYTGKANEEKERKATEQRKDTKEEVRTSKDSLSNQIKKSDSLLIAKMEKTNDDVLNNLNEIQKTARKDNKKSTNRIIDRIDSESKHQDKNQKEII